MTFLFDWGRRSRGRCALTLLVAVLLGCGNGDSRPNEGTGGNGGAGGTAGTAGTAGLGGGDSSAIVRITAPLHGTFIDESTTTIEVAGVVEGLDADTSAAALDVNGRTVPFDASDGTWSASLTLPTTGIPQSIAATFDTGSGVVANDRIVVMRGPSIAKGARAVDAAFIQVTDAGFDVIEPLALELLPIDFAAAVPRGAEVLPEGSCVVPIGDGCLVSAAAVVSGETQVNGDITVAMDAQTDAVLVDMSVNDISVPIDMSTSIGIDCAVTATLGTLSIEGAFELHPATDDPAFVDVVQSEDPPLSAMQGGVEIMADSCNVDFLTPLVNLLAGAFVPLVQDGLESFLNADLPGTDDTPIAGAIEDAMATIKVAGPVGDAIEANVDGVFRLISESEDDILLSADTDFTPRCPTVEGAPTFERSLAPAFSPEPLPITTPENGFEHHIALAVSPTGFNQILRTLTECGLLVADITEFSLDGGATPLTTRLIGVIIPGLVEQFGDAEPVRVELRPTIAPFVTGTSGPDGELLEMVVPHLRVDFVLPEADGILALSIAVDINSQGVDLAPSDTGNELGFALAAPDDSQIAVFMLENPFDAELDTIQRFLPTFLPGFLDAVVADIPGFAIPEFAGLTLTPIEVSQSSGAIGIFTTGAP